MRCGVAAVCVLVGACQFEPSGISNSGAGSSDGGPGVDGAVTPTADAQPGQPDFELVDSDPFGDGTEFAYLFDYDDKVFLGPSADGTGVVSFDTSGGGRTLFELALAADDSGGNTSRNSSTPPYPSVGFSGCADNSTCGPDNEDGRGLFASGMFGGEEILLVGGARSGGDLDYVYVTRSTTSPLQFDPIDLSATLGPSSRGFSAMHVTGDRIYLGFPDSGGARPYLLALVTLPEAGNVLDAVVDTDVFNLEADNIPGLKTGGTAIIDAMADMAGFIYLANSGAWVRSTVTEPQSYADQPEDWLIITPSSGDYTSKTSRTTDKLADLFPYDRAVPAFAHYGGRLYAGRNTTDGPQLWVCDPAEGEPEDQCEADEWSLIATNGSGDEQLSQFDNPDNQAITLLLSTGDSLLVGFDNPNGVQLFETSAADPTERSDFQGHGGCSAADHPSGCSGFLFESGVSHLYDARAIGGTLFVIAGEDAKAAALFTISSAGLGGG